MAYFEPIKVEFTSSGSQLLDCILGGGWAVGRVLNIVGDKSTGKCVRNIYTISDKGFELIDNVGANQPDGLSDKITKLATDSKTEDVSSHFWKETVDHTIKITTHHGYELEGAPDHKIKVWTKDCEFEMKQLADLRPDDIAVIAKSPIYNRKEYFKIDFKSKISSSVDDPQFHIPKYVNEKLGYLLGLIVGDGQITNQDTVRFSNEQQPWFSDLSDTKRLIGYIKDILNIEYYNSPTPGSFETVSIKLNEFLRSLMELEERPFTTINKYIPRCILESPKSVQAQFLRALIGCNSCWNAASSSFDYITTSKTLAHAVHVLLLNFGIVSSRHHNRIPDNPPCEVVAIPALYVKEFIYEIGFDSFHDKSGKEQLNEASELFPFIMAKIEEAECSYAYEYQLKTNNYHFDCIEKIEHKYEKVEVYDYHIPNNHLFWSDGFISHNTLLAIEAAANLLKMHPNANIWYIDSEAAFDESYVAALGVPVEKFQFILAETMEDVHNMLDEKIDNASSKNYGLIIIDSYDSLTSEKERDRGIEEGSFRTDKIRMLGEFFRRNLTRLEKKNISTIVINQVRDVLTSRFPMKTKTGGHVLDHNASQIIWLSEISKNEKTVNGIKRVIGLTVKAKVTKNKVGLAWRECTFDILFDYGIEDLGSNLRYLQEIKKPFTFDGKILDSDVIINNFVKKMMAGDYNDFLKVRADVAAQLKVEWDIIEEGFKPTARKYVNVIEPKKEEIKSNE